MGHRSHKADRHLVVQEKHQYGQEKGLASRIGSTTGAIPLSPASPRIRLLAKRSSGSWPATSVRRCSTGTRTSGEAPQSDRNSGNAGNRTASAPENGSAARACFAIDIDAPEKSTASGAHLRATNRLAEVRGMPKPRIADALGDRHLVDYFAGGWKYQFVPQESEC